MTIWHKSLEQRFSSFPVHQQILMVCNELNRASNLKNDVEEYNRCLERSLELLDYFMSDKKGHLLRESLRIRDIIAEAYISFSTDTKRIQSTLLQMNPTAWCMLNKV
ncbi:MAG: hypothetical protein IIB95_10495 [Candidatus Marinimicrobia bacterium]|nr:hypothetical protein [Candidatus Neomarinimicrobiota bacterium]